MPDALYLQGKMKITFPQRLAGLSDKATPSSEVNTAPYPVRAALLGFAITAMCLVHPASAADLAPSPTPCVTVKAVGIPGADGSLSDIQNEEVGKALRMLTLLLSDKATGTVPNHHWGSLSEQLRPEPLPPLILLVFITPTEAEPGAGRETQGKVLPKPEPDKSAKAVPTPTVGLRAASR